MAATMTRGGSRRPGAGDSRRPAGVLGDWIALGLCALAGVLAVVTLVEIVYQIISGASPAISRYGLAFIGRSAWQPNFDVYGAAVPLFGTVVTSAIALLIALPLGIAIALFLSLLAPPQVRVVVGPLVEMLAAVPSVIVGLWGLIVLAPFVQSTIEPFLHGVLGFTGLFGSPATTGLSVFTAGLVLGFMILPIIAALSRDLFLTVPQELRDGAEALGATRWEVIRGVVLPSTVSGVAAASMLALSRALGEAIAVALVIGDGSQIHRSLFGTGITLASRVAVEITNVVSTQHLASLFYLAAILLVIAAAANLAGQAIGRRFDVHEVVGK